MRIEEKTREEKKEKTVKRREENIRKIDMST